MNAKKQKRMENTKVELLDDPVKFAGIVTNQNHIRALTNKVQLDYTSWYNWLNNHPHPNIKISKNKQNISWVGTYHLEMITFVNDFYSGVIPKERNGDGVKKYQPNTLKIMLNALCHVLLAIDKVKFGELTRPLWNTALKIAMISEDKNEDNEMTENEQKNWICFSDLESRRDEMIELWNKDKDNTRLESTRKAHIYALILAVNTWIPPLRLDWVGMKFWKKQVEPPHTGADAYLWQKKKGEWSIVINHDKVTHHGEKIKLGRAILNIATEISGVTQGKKVNQMISDSLEVWPREFVIPSVRNPLSEMKPTGYTAGLKFLFKPKAPGQNILRKSFVNHYYPRVNTKTKKLIAERMRHSVNIAMRSYIKEGVAELCDNGDDILEDVKIVQKVGIPAKLEVKKAEYFDPQSYGLKYRADNKEKLKAKRQTKYVDNKNDILRKKLVFSANSGYVKAIRKSTIAKYNLLQDANGIWS
jgi:hypothetical protein